VPLGAQPVGQREVAIEMTRVDRADRGQFVHDHLWLGARHRLGDLIGIERISNHGCGPKLLEQSPVGLLVTHAHDLVARSNQTRQQLPSNRARRSSNKDSHHQLL
jgi:hypothetical protein